jgi:ABC-type sugar transport system permease subunit
MTNHDLRRAIRDVVMVGALLGLIALTTFVRARNRDAERAGRSHASAAATAIAHDLQPVVATAAAGIVGPPRASKTFGFLRRRAVKASTGDRVLGGPTAPAVDKLLDDAAARFERTGPFVARVPDGSGRSVAAIATPRGPAVAITAGPEPRTPMPWLALVGLAGLSLVLAGVGAATGAASRGLGVASGLLLWSIPALHWGGSIVAAVCASIAIAVGVAHHRGVTDRFLAGMRSHRTALAFLAPAGLSMVVLVVIPFAIGLALGFYDHHHGQWTFVGLANFRRILSGDGHAVSDPLNFWFILGVTLAWTFLNVLFHVVIGTGLAMVLRQPWLRARGAWRVLLIVPWAVPNYITALIWKGMFSGEYGAINSIFDGLGLDRVSWFSSWATAFSANVATNTWLGFPFMMVVALGALESIPKELEEAAEVDGASAWQRFREISLPHLRPALAPAVMLGSIWTFNQFNVIALVSGGKPGGSTDILVTDAYRWAFERGEKYGMAAAMGAIIFLLLLGWTVIGRMINRSADEARP